MVEEDKIKGKGEVASETEENENADELEESKSK